MNILFEASFAKDLRRIKNTQLLQRIQNIITNVKTSDTLTDIHNLRKMQGFDTFYRIRLGDYRIGIEIFDEKVIFVRALHRKDIYRRFP